MPLLNKNFSVKKAHESQICLSKKVIHTDILPPKIETIGGVDVSYFGEIGVSAITVLNYDSMELLEAQVTACHVTIPYIPTLLSFRELPPVLAGIKKLQLQPDIFLVDAQGWAHPYRCGFASHLGLVLKKPTIGAAKSRLIGEEIKKDDRTVLVDKAEVIGEVITTKQDTKPVYVSVGHMVSLDTAVKIVRHCLIDRIPEPLMQAHKLATKERRRLQAKAK